MSNKRPPVDKRCARCGEMMYGVDPLRKFCLDCSEWKHVHEKKPKKPKVVTIEQKIPPKAPPKTITQVVREARKRGLSYGQYVAQMK